MGNSECTATSSSMIVEMLVETHGWLEEDEGSSDDETNDHMRPVQLVDTLTEHDSEGETNNQQDDAENLKWRVNIANFLGGWKVQSERKEGKAS